MSVAQTALYIRRAERNEDEVLFDIWWRSVCATHTFVSATDLRAFAQLVREMGLAGLGTWVLLKSAAAPGPMGFMLLSSGKIEALFLAPESFRCGGGTALIRHAHSLHARLTVDVNEQNIGAVQFYRACGFTTIGRSELDDSGRPYPLLHMAAGQ